MNDLSNVTAGTDVFFFASHSKYPQVKQVSRTTGNFVFLAFQNAIGEKFETKFRKINGSGIDRFDGNIRTIEPGEIEQIETEKRNEKRINEIITFLNTKGFRFNGHQQWYSIETWEKLAESFK
jgi:hypothetical protein